MRKINKLKKIIKDISKSDNFQKAFIHSSFQNEKKLPQGSSYECLEFLGDSILNFHVSLFIYEKYPSFSEGQMSKLKQFIVKESSLEEISKNLKLDNFLKLGKAEKKNGGLKKTRILADIFESLIAAIYLEKGEFTVREFLRQTLLLWSEGKEDLIWDYKTKLQEFCQSKKNNLKYNLIKTLKNKKGEKEFFVEIVDEFGLLNELGTGKTKKNAEQEAALKAMKKLELI